ncbi:MAG: radical SAM protein [bacterium]
MASPVPAEQHPPAKRRMNLLLIKPSKYDDDGYVIRHFRGVLPSNTLACIHSLTEEVVARGDLGPDAKVNMVVLDETVEKIAVRKLASKYIEPGVRSVVALCGVQTNQYPRAVDLARQFKTHGFAVMIGGFHVSGAIEMSHTGKIPPECQEMIDEGITLVKGEIENEWGSILKDFYFGAQKNYYDILDKPDLQQRPIPTYNKRYFKRFMHKQMSTLDAGRGCPFTCSFCTIINVQGRTMRYRSADVIKQHIRDNYKEGIRFYFFTDDNFARNKSWKPIFQALIELREEENIFVDFMMQIDTLAWKIPDFVDLAHRAGCTQVFIGMETIEEDNLAAAGKRQNKVADYVQMIETFSEREIQCHVGYIIGFPNDTPERIRKNVHTLIHEVKVDMASFFMLTPLPGSADHVRMAKAGEWMSDDYNAYDSFHATTHHPHMNAEQWYNTYLECWDTFYSVENMKTALKRRKSVKGYWDLFWNYLWYRNSVLERTHPMICGFWRQKSRDERNPALGKESRWAFLKRRVRDLRRDVKQFSQLFFELQELWLATRPRREWHLPQVPDWREGVESLRQGAEEMSRRFSDGVRNAQASLSARIAKIPRPSLGYRLGLMLAPRVRTRFHLDRYWTKVKFHWERRHFVRLSFHTPLIMVNALREVRMSTSFALALFSAGV